jgi:hypothetical protein
MKGTLWMVTFLSQSPGAIKPPPNVIVRAHVCEEQNGALVFRSGDHLSIKMIIARGQWLLVRRQSEN